MKTSSASPLIRVRRSKVHGAGVFAATDIKKGTRILEYVGERISHAEADRRYADKDHDDNHTFLFTVSTRTVIDGGNGGNDARYINHSCDPNCETLIEDGRVYIEAIRNIPKGAELGYDYLIERDASDPPDIDVIFACRCGSPKCRGTMLLPPKPVRKKRKTATRAVAKKSARKSAGIAEPASSARRKVKKKGGKKVVEKRAGRRDGNAPRKSAKKKGRSRA